MQKNCKKCTILFEITDEDLQYYDLIAPVIGGKKYSLPLQTLCADCRQQRRLSFRNERKLYHRKCARCSKEIISVYSSDKPFPVYCSECWWGDGWSALDNGQEFDFTRSFFEQYKELLLKVPQLANMVWNSTNCEFNSFCDQSKDCYLSSRIGNSENVLYTYLPLRSQNYADCTDIFECQLCYECVDCWNCYGCRFCQLCKNTSDSAFCYDCIGCSDCFGCVGLRNAKYYFFNQKCTKEQYEEYLKKYPLSSSKSIAELRQKFYQEELLKKPVRSAVILNCENASGNYLSDSKNVVRSFDIEKTDSVRDSWGVEYSKDIADCDYIYYGERCYENISNSHSSNIYFSFAAINCSNLLYSMICFNDTHDCFGCVALKKQKYCILNKQYTKEEYEALVPKIIEHMKKTGEWGEFFPSSLSAFSYNESLAQDHFPLTKQEVEKQGLTWKEDENTNRSTSAKISPPDTISQVSDELLKQIFTCAACDKNYRIIPQELKFYRQMRLPIPQKCPDCRHKSRFGLRNPKKLYSRTCMKCSAPIQTTYAAERAEIVYCEKCYLEAIY